MPENTFDIIEVSPYDSAYPVTLLSHGLKTKLAQAQDFITDVYMTVAKEAPTLAQAQQAMQTGGRYVVDMTETTLNAIESGKIKLSTSKNGKVYAQLMREDGKYSTKLPIKREAFRKGIDSAQMASALQLKALQDQVENISIQIRAIDQSVRDVLQGQQNDRIGQYYSGLALFLESKTISEKELRTALIAQSLRALSEATFQLSLTMQSDIQYLANKTYQSEKGKRVELIDRRMSNINQSFAVIHQATMLRAGIYCEQGEMLAMASVLNEYSRFIENTVAKNSALLSQCDVADNGTSKGLWQSRAKLMLDVSGLVKQLSAAENTLYLGITKENHE